ncbi:MAG: prolipoprotein diacylglyceryl transferase [Clostridia bacterium]|nr:prolipoprotein diacylglyceryl transferase [Clostridia bacterium]
MFGELEKTIVSFPGLGIGELELNKIAFTLFGKFEVRWYGLIITLGILFAVLYVIFRGKKNEHVVADDIIDIALLTVVLGVIGARAYYVLTSLDQYESIGEAFAIWNGGLGIYGGIIGGCLGIVIMCYFKKISWRKLFDMAAPGVMIAQAMGRWGNFFNGEAYGYAIGDTTRFFFFNKEFVLTSGEGTVFNTFRMGLQQFGYTYYYHPTFLYESAWNILGFVIVNILYKHKRFHGQWALFYFAWYGFGRMFIEGFRTDSLYVPGTNIRISQLLGLVFFIGASVALLTLTILTRKRAPLLVLEDAAYEAAKKVEEELAQTEGAEQPVQTQKVSDSISQIWNKVVCKVKSLFKKQSQEQNPKKKKIPPPQEAEEENDNGKKN